MIESIAIKQAKEFAHTQLSSKPRISGESYYEHSHKVYKALIKVGIEDESMLIAALLHHIDKSLDTYIKDRFGPEIVQIVEGLRKLSEYDIKVQSPLHNNDKYFIQTYLNITKDIKILLIRLVDRSVNIKTAYVHPPLLRTEIAEKGMYLYAPICRLLGFSKITNILEDEAFKLLYPDQYFNVVKFVEKKKPGIRKFFDDAVPFLKGILLENGFENVEIKTRIKHYYGIYKKSLRYLQKNNEADVKFTNILDIAGLRIIVDTIDQCYLSEDIVNKIWQSIPNEREDYIKKPKPSGYQSIHIIFAINTEMNLEVQIRTHKMHEENEFGNASHFFYKIGDKFKENVLENPNWLREINFWENQSGITDNRGITQFKEFVYAFTPKGDIIELPRGANIIDFAYSIHSKIGNNCIGAKVNDAIVKLDYEIKDGDRVDIITSKHNKKPSKDWIKIAKTKKAVGLIRKSLDN